MWSRENETDNGKQSKHWFVNHSRKNMNLLLSFLIFVAEISLAQWLQSSFSFKVQSCHCTHYFCSPKLKRNNKDQHFTWSWNTAYIFKIVLIKATIGLLRHLFSYCDSLVWLNEFCWMIWHWIYRYFIDIQMSLYRYF